MAACLLIFGLFKQPPSLPIGFAPRGRLDLAPIPAFARAIGRISALAYYALKASFLGHAQQRLAVLEWFGQRTTSPSSTAALAGSSCSSCAMDGKRSVKLCPLRLNTTTREPILWASER